MIKMSIWLVALPFMPHGMHHDASQCITWQSLEGILAQFSFHNHSCWDASLDNQTLWLLDPIKILDYHLKHTIADEHARMLWRHPSDWMRQPVVKNANQMRCAEIDTQQHILPNRFNRCLKPRTYIQNSKQKIILRPAWCQHQPSKLGTFSQSRPVTATPWPVLCWSRSWSCFWVWKPEEFSK